MLTGVSAGHGGMAVYAVNVPVSVGGIQMSNLPVAQNQFSRLA
jgi:hypothetical protein